MKPACLLLFLCVLSAVVRAEQTDACAGMDGSALTQCRLNQQTLRQQQLEQQLQQQQERQAQLDRQQREVQQQLETMRQENASLRREMEREAAVQSAARSASPPARQLNPGATDAAAGQVLRGWKDENPWFGTDYARTQFAMRYTRQLQKDRPDLTGRALLDAVAAKVNEQFGTGK